MTSRTQDYTSSQNFGHPVQGRGGGAPPRPSTSWPLMAQSNAEGHGRDPDLQVWLEHAPCVLEKEKGRRETS